LYLLRSGGQPLATVFGGMSDRSLLLRTFEAPSILFGAI
jgi:hypothetical protein